MTRLLPVLLATVLLAGCGEVDQQICTDVPEAQRAIGAADIRQDFKQELLDDVAERANEANCPGFEDAGDTE